MKFVVIGLGSMGKRRIRNLLALNIPAENIIGFDTNPDRCQEVTTNYQCLTLNNELSLPKLGEVDLYIVSTPPDQHIGPIEIALRNKSNCFVEASVMHQINLRELDSRFRRAGLFLFPSSTFRHYPGPRKIREILSKKKLGKILYYNYIVGQYLPDWHPWEDIRNFYVSKKETGACREIVAFELTWLSEIFGLPTVLNSTISKLSDLPIESDDYYNFQVLHDKNLLGSITVEVLSRPSVTRRLVLIGTEGKLNFLGDKRRITLELFDNSAQNIELDSGTIEKGYVNPEEPYIQEIQSVLKAIEMRDASLFPNSIEKDTEILDLLNEIERCNSFNSFKRDGF